MRHDTKVETIDVHPVPNTNSWVHIERVTEKRLIGHDKVYFQVWRAADEKMWIDEFFAQTIPLEDIARGVANRAYSRAIQSRDLSVGSLALTHNGFTHHPRMPF